VDGRWAGHVALMDAKKNVYGIFVGTPEGNTPQGKPKRRRDNIKVDLNEKYDGVVWA
jgi:hypothetical protein